MGGQHELRQAQIEELLGNDSAMARITVAERLVNAMERSSMPARDHDLALMGKYARI